jgi:hypothetical protein
MRFGGATAAGLGSQGKGTSYVNGKSTQWMISIDSDVYESKY